MAATLALFRNSPEASLFLRGEIAQESSYTLKDAPSIAPALVDGLVQAALDRVERTVDVRMRREGLEALKQFRLSATGSDLDFSTAPPLEIVDAEDGSMLIEWSFADRKLGFNIEPRQGQSGWYYAFSRKSGGQCGSGPLESLDMQMLLRLMLTR